MNAHVLNCTKRTYGNKWHYGWLHMLIVDKIGPEFKRSCELMELYKLVLLIIIIIIWKCFCITDY